LNPGFYGGPFHIGTTALTMPNIGRHLIRI
jgi:hypothetical protein